MEVLNVGGDDPQEFSCAGKHVDDDALVDVFVEDEVGHFSWYDMAGNGSNFLMTKTSATS